MPITPATAVSRSSDDSPEAVILLELVDEDGNTIGTAEKLSAHQAPGRLHRAFSVFLFDERGRLLLQQRALGKYHSPASGPTPAAATPTRARRRSPPPPGAPSRSWGLPALLGEAGTVRYNHPDPASGLVEQEYNHLFVGLVRDPLRPDPEEVGDTVFVTPAELAERHEAGPFSAWFMTVLDAARPAIRELTGDSRLVRLSLRGPGGPARRPPPGPAAAPPR